MEDRELLELAAKALGGEYIKHKIGGMYLAFPPNWNGSPWNPLTDDGDSLRLAAALDIGLRLNGDEITGIAHWFRAGKSNRVAGNYHTGNTAEVRRLIVRAAAEIGKSIT